MAKNNRAFTLIELLIVIMIIGVLAAMVLSINFQKQLQKARDGKRKVDIEQIRSALEMCRSDSVTGGYPTLTSPICGGPLTCGSNTYLNPMPCDPKSPTNQYTFSGGGTDYTLTATLETGGTYTGKPTGSY